MAHRGKGDDEAEWRERQVDQIDLSYLFRQLAQRKAAAQALTCRIGGEVAGELSDQREQQDPPAPIRVADRGRASRTSAGPNANQLLPGTLRTRLAGTFPLMISGAIPSASDSATSSGTSETGKANSIGTNTACVGTVKPAPTSNRT